MVRRLRALVVSIYLANEVQPTIASSDRSSTLDFRHVARTRLRPTASSAWSGTEKYGLSTASAQMSLERS